MVSAKTLQAVVRTDPWGVTFTDPTGRIVLNEAGVSFRTGADWWQATRVVSLSQHGHRLTATVATTHPERTLAVTIAAAGDGVIELRIQAGSADAYRMSFEATETERYLGFGERNNAVDQRGNVVENYVSDGPWQPDEHPFIAPYIPAWGLRDRTDATYFPMPWLLSTSGYGVLVDNSETSYFRLATDDPRTWSAEVVGSPADLRLRVFGGPTPAAALTRLTAAIGRQPSPAAPWFLGPWLQATGAHEQQLAQLQRLRDADAPVSVVQTYGHYLPSGTDRTLERQRTKDFHARNVAVTTYFNPMIDIRYHAAYDPAAAAGAFTKGPDGKPYVYLYGLNNTDVSQLDFTTTAGQAAFERLLSEAVDDGFDGWMEDFGEYTPPDSNGVHNHYPVEYHHAAQSFANRAGRPLARYVRSGWTGSASGSPIVWGGDPTTGWGFDGLTSAVRGGLTMGTSGVALWGSDIGGYFALGPNSLTPELLTRWVQLGLVSGVMRTQAEGTAVPPKPRPQVWDDDQIDNWRRYAKLRTQLYPYLAAAAAEYRATGLPIMRHLALAYPTDSTAVARDDEFLFGPNILAAPILEPGARTRTLYAPTGSWIDLWRSVTYSAGALELGTPHVVDGGQELTIPAPLDELPLLIRSGALLPLLPSTVNSLYGTEIEAKRMILAFPHGFSSARMDTRGRLYSAETPDGWTLTIASSRPRHYDLHAALGTLRQPFHPRTVTLNGHALPSSAWSYNETNATMHASFDTTLGVLHTSRK